MATKLIRYQMPSRQMLTVHVPEGSDERDVLGPLENEFSRLANDQKQEISKIQDAHKTELDALRAEIKALKSHIASDIVLAAKQRAGDAKFDEREETEYYLGLDASRLIREANHVKASAPRYAPTLGAPRGGSLYSDAPGIAVQ